ncbi:hypothetical protein [Exiguobacterium chiriqhucha]|uniref:Uncharacterized protein n=1 Tax=Exiguobacterium chiriqhucha RW-2 TaxID=1345023 RepID=U1M0J6_9BACL|nr:hypothetical protein [Exiguobacterium chiriqhucha]ERG68534.1 hypothetical protein M467_14755 [Exiguobacterium chiriqhucha RW-2]
MTQRERFEQLYHSGKRSTRQAALLFSLVTGIGFILLMSEERLLAELIWFVLLVPSIFLVKIWAGTNTLLRFNSSPEYTRLVRLEFWVTMGLYGIGWIMSSKIDQQLAKIDPEHVTHKVYERGKVGFFPK